MAEYPKHPFLLSVEETAKALGTDVDKGLTSAQVADLQSRYPPNELDVGGTVPWYKIFAKQLFNAMILVSLLRNPWKGWSCRSETRGCKGTIPVAIIQISFRPSYPATLSN